MWILRVLSSILFLFSIILTIPISFDVGGRTCGLAFSLALSIFYFFYSILRIVTPDRSRFRYSLLQFVAVVQWILLPSMLIWALGHFAVDADNNGGWVERTFGGKRAEFTSVREWIFGREGLVESFSIEVWDKVLHWSIPVFQLVEGFCSLLCIQAAGQITRYLVNRDGRSDSWMIGLLALSGTIISIAIYFLIRVMQFPEISNVDSTLIGAAVTCAVILCAWGIGSGRGNPIESSLLFAYVVLCIYQIFTDYQPSHPIETSMPPTEVADFPPFPPIIMASYTTLIHALSTLPTFIIGSFGFMTAALQTVTPSVLVSLTYRILVLYAATRIIPAIRESGARALSQEPSMEDADGAGRVLGFLSYFSPSILISVYTSLLMQHFANTNGSNAGIMDWWTAQGGASGVGNIWKWINLAGTMGLYVFELYISQDDDDVSLTSNWKED